MVGNTADAATLLRDAYFKKIGYEPHPGQVQFHGSDARFRFANCGRRYGKSMMVARDLEPRMLQANKQFWIVGPTYDLAEKEFRVIWQDMIVKLGFGRDPNVQKIYNKRQGTMAIHFKDRNTLLEVKSAQNAENLVGDSLDHVIMSEAAKHSQETWDRYIRPALSDRRGSADFATTPEGFNWIYDQWMLGQNPAFPEYASWKFPSWMNTFVYPGGVQDPEIVLLRKTMSSTAFTQEIAADFGAFVGKIYQDWDVSKHIKSHTYNPNWPNYIAFDFGFTNPLAAVEFQVSPQDTVHIWREYYKSFTRLEVALQEMKGREQPQGYKIDLCFGDAADPEAIETINAKFAPCVGDPNAKTNWRDGIDLVTSFIEREVGEDEYGGPIYGPALFVDPQAENTVREFNNYKADPKSNGTNTAETARKQDDHAMDALRYGLVHIYRLGATYRLSDTITITTTAGSKAGSAPPTTQINPTPRPITDNSALSLVNDASDGSANTGSQAMAMAGGGLIFETGGYEGYFTQLGDF